MTITYTAEVATCHKFGCFLKLLSRWRGSIYKLVWIDLLVYLSIYYGLNFLYRIVLDEDGRKVFESLVDYCNSYGSLIPLSFVLGFYVSVVMERWWSQYMTIPWPDTIAVFVSAHVHGQDERGRVMRRTVMRYVCLCQTIVLKIISPRVHKRFPTLNHLVEAGLLLENERVVIEGMDHAFPGHPMHWMPIVWAASIITRARKEGRIRDDFSVKTIIDELNKFRGQCGVLMYFNSINVPLVYTQVVTLAVYSYFLCTVIGHQWTERVDEEGFMNLVDKYFPFFTTLQFFFYMGWLKVAESLINPFGEDDDDFEVNWMIDRNLQVSYLIVDEMHHDHPELVRDQYWDEVFPNELPYANEQDKRDEPPEASTARLEFNRSLLSILSSIKINGLDPHTDISPQMVDSLISMNTRRTLTRKSDDNKSRVSKSKSKSSSSSEGPWPTAIGSKSPSLSDPGAEEIPHTSGGKHMTNKQSGNVRIADQAIAEDEERERLSANVQSRANSMDLSSRATITTLPDGAGDEDDFDRLKAERERQRLERQRMKYMRNLNRDADSGLYPYANQPPSYSPSRAVSIDMTAIRQQQSTQTTQTTRSSLGSIGRGNLKITPPPPTDESQPEPPPPPPPTEKAKDEEEEQEED